MIKITKRLVLRALRRFIDDPFYAAILRTKFFWLLYLFSLLPLAIIRQTICAYSGFWIIRLPPGIPELNPVEHLWHTIKEKFFNNQLFKSLDAAKERLIKAVLWAQGSVEFVKTTIGFN